MRTLISSSLLMLLFAATLPACGLTVTEERSFSDASPADALEEDSGTDAAVVSYCEVGCDTMYPFRCPNAAPDCVW